MKRQFVAASNRAASLSALVVALSLSACAGQNDEPTSKPDTAATADSGSAGSGSTPNAETGMVRPPKDPFPSTYQPYPSETVALVGATVLDGAGRRIDGGTVVMQNGRILAVGPADEVAAPEGATIVDADGKWVTPGIIDIHSHLGDYPSPSTASTADGNEATSPNTSQVWAEHSVWPQDAGFTRALAGGVTSLQILPGSANLFGGRSVVLKNVPGRTVQDMKFPGAPYGMKMACGENPKRVYEKQGPSTRMGNVAGYRAAWIEADAYRKKWRKYEADYKAWEDKNGSSDDKSENKDAKAPDAPSRDLKLETLALALDGDVIVNMHCYRADEMVIILDMAKEFGYKVASFHHGVEAYKIADHLAREGVCGAVWADWWGFKLEAYDAIPENAALIDAQPNGCAIIHSDDALGIQRLNQETAKAAADGRRMGFDIPYERAIQWITLNPARAMGVGDVTGSLEAGKMADAVVWSGDPFSTFSRAERVYIDGALMFDRNDPARSPRVDFELGQNGNGFTGGAGQ